MNSEAPLTSLGQRTLAAIVFTDVVDFSARVGQAEEHTLNLVQRDLNIMSQLCKQHGGHVLKFTGDGLLIYFSSAFRAVTCAQEFQHAMARAANSLPESDALWHRCGIHLGDVFVSETDVMGDGVNIAARLQGEAQPGGVCMSQTVYDVVKKRLTLKATYLGPRDLKNIQEPVHVYQILMAAMEGRTSVASIKNVPLELAPSDELSEGLVATPSPLTPAREVEDIAPNAPQSALQESSPAIAASVRKPPFSVLPSTQIQLTELVIEHMGPIGKLTVHQALAQSSDGKELIAEISQWIPASSVKAFRQQAERLLHRDALASPPEPLTPPPPVADPPAKNSATSTAVTAAIGQDEAFMHYCRQELTQAIGPIASLLVRRVLNETPSLSRPQLVDALVEEVTEPQAAKELRDRLLAWRQPSD
ncbi:adenylate/guanylate cyclase domain-containing protein [Synechococcus sp. PCC 7336]|uniref:adenylate/guanylate cyclase domain-containing protein n=1 Tax=Synechococcus sp. PCC 7336 TaxID=195250 RepID=UPI00034D7284|nr:adenylate/guanylate cyclase domain-containing protein [Synechococcus sp. PCC 7336]